MKVILNCTTPFMLAHGGLQVQIEETKAALEQLGVAVEPLRWWDEHQTGDILHHFGPCPAALTELARAKGWTVVNTITLSQTCNRPWWQLLARKICIRAVLAGCLPRKWKRRLPWQAYHEPDLIVVGLQAERRVMERLYGLKRTSVAVVPLGLADAFLRAGPSLRTETHLICTGTIAPVKNSVELARLAVQAQVPILFVGKPFAFARAYWEKFQSLIDQEFVKYVPHVGEQRELIELLHRARGFALASRYENWSLAAHEAAACGLPLLLPDQRWARERFGDQAHYISLKRGPAAVVALKRFHEQSLSLHAPKVRLYSWLEVGEMLQTMYAKLLAPQALKRGHPL